MIKIHYEHIFATLAKLLASIDEFDPKQQQLGSVNGNFKFLGSHALFNVNYSMISYINLETFKDIPEIFTSRVQCLTCF